MMEENKIPLNPPFSKGEAGHNSARSNRYVVLPPSFAKGGAGGGFSSAPYPGLRPYTESEQGKFFGREADKSILVDKILGNRLTLLFAASGVGKSSLLQAAVIPHLRADSGENLSVACNTDWVSEPLGRLREVILAALRADGTLPADAHAEAGTLAELLDFCGLFARTPLVLILDQFEEFFRYQRHSAAFRPFIEQLTEVIIDKALPVSVVISMREDYAMELNAFKPKLPTLLFENFYRLEKLNKKAATMAILDPAKLAGCDYEEALLQRLLHDLKDRKREQGGLPHAAPVEGQEAVDPPYLQIVCAYLWKLKGEKETTLRLANYDKAGGIDGILNNFLNDVLASLTPAEKQLASRAFDYLAAQRGIKMAYPLDVLARILRVKEPTLSKVLAKLTKRDMNILRDQTRNDVIWYELYHDMFSDSIDKWNNAWKAQRLKRQRLVSRVVIAVLVVVLGVLGDSLWWLSNNSIFPAQYLFKEQEFRLMNWGFLPEPLPDKDMVTIQPSKGEFKMGDPEVGFENTFDDVQKAKEQFGIPNTTAVIQQAFDIGRHEITYEQYDYYVWQRHRAGVNAHDLDYPTGATRDNGRGLRAVTQVNWNEANAYTKWLSDKTGQEYRLPTEVEWEYSARARTDGKYSPYWWGDEVKGKNGEIMANCNGCGSDWDNKLIAPVGQFGKNAFGLYDTAGNVWEWTCSEWQKQFDGSEGKCATDTSGGRVIRGGSWSSTSDWVRSSARNWYFPDYRNDSVGFRILRVPRQDN